MRRASQITLIVGGILVGAAWCLGRFDVFGIHQAASEVLTGVVAVLLVILGWRYRRDRLVAAAVLIAGADFLIRSGRVGNPLGPSVLALFVAIDIATIAIIRDRPLHLLRGMAWIGVLGVQAWATMYGIQIDETRFQPWFDHPWLVPAATIGAIAVVAAAFIIRRGAFEGSLIWVAVVAALVFNASWEVDAIALFFAAAALAVLTGVIEDSYRLAFHDELTGLPGRRALDETLRSLSGQFTISMADVDNFKRFNDRHGHDAGDQALRMVADEMATVGGGGRAFRYGGEEFAIVFPGKTVPDTREHLEGLRQSIAERRFALRGPDRPKSKPERPKKGGRPARTVNVTVSFGAAATDSRRSTAGAVIRAADRALYRAKKAGRNRVVAAGDRLKR